MSGQRLAVDVNNDVLPEGWETANSCDSSAARYKVNSEPNRTCTLQEMDVIFYRWVASHGV